MVMWKPCEFFDFCFDAVDCVRSSDVQCECLVLGRFDEDLNVTTKIGARTVRTARRVVRRARRMHFGTLGNMITTLEELKSHKTIP